VGCDGGSGLDNTSDLRWCESEYKKFNGLASSCVGIWRVYEKASFDIRNQPGYQGGSMQEAQGRRHGRENDQPSAKLRVLVDAEDAMLSSPIVP